MDTPPNWEAEGQSINDPERGACPAPVEIIILIYSWITYIYRYDYTRTHVHLRVLGTSEFPPHANAVLVREQKTPELGLTWNLASALGHGNSGFVSCIFK